MNLNSVISRRQRRSMWVPIQSRCSWVKVWTLVTPVPWRYSAVRTCGPEASGIIIGTWKMSFSSARRARKRWPISASRT